MIINKWTKEQFVVNTPWDKLNNTDKLYCELITNILENGLWKQNRTGIKTISIFGPQLIFENIGKSFPLLTQKKVYLHSIIGELLWFLEGSTDKNRLKEHYGTSIWDEWDAPNPKFDGDMGPIYGNQWVNWAYTEDGQNKSINQLQNIIETLKVNPDDRRMIVSAWHVEKIPEMALPPCHWSFQFYTNQIPGEEKRRLHLLWNQRSVDTGLGLPFNITSYAILLIMVAQQVDMIPGDLIGNLGDTHIYENHIEKLCTQSTRESKSCPLINIEKQKDLWSYKPEHFHIENYNPHPVIKMEISV